MNSLNKLYQEPINGSIHLLCFLGLTLSRVDLFLNRLVPAKSIILLLGQLPIPKKLISLPNACEQMFDVRQSGFEPGRASAPIPQ